MDTIDKILQLVQESGLTAKEYAINAGLGAGNITDWKTGRSKPSVESLKKIAKYAGVQLEWLTGNSDFKTEQEEFDNYNHNQNKILILKTIDRYYYEYVIPCNLKEKDIDFIVNTLSDVNFQNVKEKKKQINSYVNSFDQNKSKKVRTLINIIIKEMIEDLKNKNTFIYYSSLLNKKVSNTIDTALKYYMCPVYGRIAAGQPNWVEECIEGKIPIDPELMNIINPEECFFLKVNGESMNKLVKNGAFALIRKTDVVENGEVAVVLVNGYDATLKKFKTLNNGYIMLEPQSNSDEFEPIIIDPKKDSIKILGKYIGKMEMK